MNALLKFSLEAKFGKDVDIQGLIEVINASGKTVVATEKILGIYEEEEFTPTIDSQRYNADGEECKFISFNPFSDRVKFSFMKKASEYKYYSRISLALACDKEGEIYAKEEHLTSFPKLFFKSEREFRESNPGLRCSYDSFPVGALESNEKEMHSSSWRNNE